MNVLFVCLGNICRSPSADGMLRKKLAEHGLDEKVTVDSAGTGDWHIGKAPDQRSQAAAAARGYAISNLRARQVVAEDFDKFDYVLAMDKSNIENMKEFMPSGKVRTQPELILERFGNDRSGGFFGFVQCTALGLGGFTMPAMCPDDDRVKRTLPGRSCVVLYVDFHGAMWS